MPQLSLSLCPTSLIPLLAMLGITWGALKAADASRIVDFLKKYIFMKVSYIDQVFIVLWKSFLIAALMTLILLGM